ncbi:MAG: ABC transporter ATP-binding protein, partial [Thermoleophilia bacterium]|nr:ABC transporter ATP-binding protein [Thermoleophilia bacterium]
LVRLPGVERRRPDQLSGGQAQRIALARSLISRPPVLLLDEPLTALDLKLRKAMQLELRRIQEELGTTFLYVTHDQEEALTMSDRIVLMNDGRIVQEGDPTEIYNHPANVFASHFIGEANVLEGVVTAAGGDGTRVRVDGLELVASPADVTEGQEVAVSIRPERLAIAQVNGGDGPVLRGVVARRVFLGNLVRWLVELAPGVLVTVEGPAGEDELGEGATAYVRWPAEAALVLPAE